MLSLGRYYNHEPTSDYSIKCLDTGKVIWLHSNILTRDLPTTQYNFDYEKVAKTIFMPLYGLTYRDVLNHDELISYLKYCEVFGIDIISYRVWNDLVKYVECFTGTEIIYISELLTGIKESTVAILANYGLLKFLNPKLLNKLSLRAVFDCGATYTNIMQALSHQRCYEKIKMSFCDFSIRRFIKYIGHAECLDIFNPKFIKYIKRHRKHLSGYDLRCSSDKVYLRSRKRYYIDKHAVIYPRPQTIKGVIDKQLEYSYKTYNVKMGKNIKVVHENTMLTDPILIYVKSWTLIAI